MARANNKLIIQTGEALWGERWQAEMARALGVHRDTVQDWRQGRAAPRPGVYVDLLRLAQARATAIGALMEPLRQAADDS